LPAEKAWLVYVAQNYNYVKCADGHLIVRTGHGRVGRGSNVLDPTQPDPLCK